MKNIIYLCILSLSIASFSQGIKGHVFNSKTNAPIERAAVGLFYEHSTTAAHTTFTNEKGNFEFAGPISGDFVLKVNFMGYLPFSESIKLANAKSSFNIGMIPSLNQLDEAVIKGMSTRVAVKEDTIIYDAKSYKTHKDATVEDLVKKMPGITSENGVIKAHGEEVKKVTVDGQDYFGDDANIALRNLPAETVDKVQVFDALSEQSRFTGFDDGNTTKTINLQTKAGKKEGYFGKAYAGYGTQDRYQGGGNINYLNGAQRISVLGMLNNINNLNFSTSEIVGAMTGNNMGNAGNAMMRGMQFGMRVAGGGPRGDGPMSNFSVSNQNGVNKASSLGVNYVDLWGKKLRFSGNYFFNRTDNYTLTNSLGQNIINPNNILYTNTQSESNSTIFNNRFNTKMEGMIDDNNSFIWTNKLSIQESNAAVNTTTKNYITEGINLNKNGNDVMSNSKTVSFTTNFLYRLKMAKKGRTLSFNSIIDINDQNGNSVQQTNFTSGSLSYVQLNSNNQQWNTTITGVATYTEPSGKFGQWLLTYNPSIAFKKNIRETYLSNSQSTTPYLSDSLSSTYSNPLFYNTGGISYRLQYKKWRFMFGTNVQNVTFDGRSNYPTSSTFNQSFFNVLPHFNIQFNPTKMEKLRINYVTSINVPSIGNIQPVLDISNPNSYFNGNANLKQEYNHNLFMHYMKPNIVKGSFLFFMTNLNYITDKNSSFNYTAINDTTLDGIFLRKGVQYNKTINLDGFFTGMVYGNYSFPVKAIKSNLSLNLSMSYTKTPSMINFVENKTSSYTPSTGIMLTSNISEFVDFSISYNPSFTYNTYSVLSNYDNSFWKQYINTNLKITLFKDFVFNNDFQYSYSTQINPALNQHLFLWGASLGYKMLKDKNAELKLSAFDILN